MTSRAYHRARPCVRCLLAPVCPRVPPCAPVRRGTFPQLQLPAFSSSPHRVRCGDRPPIVIRSTAQRTSCNSDRGAAREFTTTGQLGRPSFPVPPSITFAPRACELCAVHSRQQIPTEFYYPCQRCRLRPSAASETHELDGLRLRALRKLPSVEAQGPSHVTCSHLRELPIRPPETARTPHQANKAMYISWPSRSLAQCDGDNRHRRWAGPPCQLLSDSVSSN